MSSIYRAILKVAPKAHQFSNLKNPRRICLNIEATYSIYTTGRGAS